MQLDSTPGEIAGRIPRPAVTTEYKFTIEALRPIRPKDTTTTELFANNIGVGQSWSGEDNVAFQTSLIPLFNGLGATGWIVFNEVSNKLILVIIKVIGLRHCR